MTAVAAVALVAATGRYVFIGGPKEPVPTNVVEALAHAARCAQRRETGFRLEDYDAIVTRLRKPITDKLFDVSFVQKDTDGKILRRFRCLITDYGYCESVMTVDEKGIPIDGHPGPR